MSRRVCGAVTADFAVRRGAFEAAVALDLSPGEVLGVLGPNGSGKSSLLSALAGVTPVTRGDIVLDGRVLSRPGHTEPPEKRRIGLLGQDPLLFPHLTALGNVAFSLRAAGIRRTVAEERARALLDAVLVSADEAGRRPAELSGGQQQRVALARALAAGPDLLLLDEPLAALDVETAPAVREVLRERLRSTGLSAIVVSHDVLDVVVLADRVLVLDGGRTVAEGDPGVVLGAPRTPFIAALAGVNLVTGVYRGGRVAAPDGRLVAGIGRVDAPNGAAGAAVDGATAAAVFSPAAVALFRDEPHGSPRNVWPATVLAIEPAAGAVSVRLSGDPPIRADLTPAAVTDLGLHPGLPLWASVKATEVRLYTR